MHDLRRQALESKKTVSRKAQSKVSSRTSSATHSRTQSRNVSRHGSDDEEENLSDGTTWSLSNSVEDTFALEGEDDGTEAWRVELNDRIEEIINRKRSTVQGRETALLTFTHLTKYHYAYAELHKKTPELMPAFFKSVKKESSEKETTMALKAIAMTLITVPSEVAYDSICDTLKHCFTDSESHIVKAAAIHVLGVAAVYGGAADAEIEDLMDEFLEIIESDGVSIGAEDSAVVVIAASEAWGYLATSIDDMEDRTEAAMEAFVEQLESSDPNVQIAAGENVALLFEKSYTGREAQDDPVSEGEEDNAETVPANLVKRYTVYRQIDQLKHTLRQLSTISTRFIAKSDRKNLHKSFSDILNTAEYPWRGPRYSTAENPVTGKDYGSRLFIKVPKLGTMKIDSWWKLHRLQALRRVLGGGFVVHYEHNEVIFQSLPIMADAEEENNVS